MGPGGARTSQVPAAAARSARALAPPVRTKSDGLGGANGQPEKIIHRMLSAVQRVARAQTEDPPG